MSEENRNLLNQEELFELKFIGKILRAEREKQNVTIKDLSKKIGVSAPSISNFENSKHGGTNLKIIKRYCLALDIDPQKILFPSDKFTDRKKEIESDDSITLFFEYYRSLNERDKMIAQMIAEEEFNRKFA